MKIIILKYYYFTLY